MKTVADLLRRGPVWVHPAHRIETAIVLMRGHDLGGLPVLDGGDEGGRLVGMLLQRHLLGVDRDRRVQDVMDTDIPGIAITSLLPEAADLMAERQCDWLAVLDSESQDEGKLVGLLAQSDLLRELRYAVDPLTGLPWSDSMRSWALEKLRNSHEITILFIDVNDFGKYNKRHGHVIGDAVLHEIAEILRNNSDATRDSICRYGGDEFCIASLRRAPEAERLARQLEAEVSQISMPAIPNERVGITVGSCGGRRTQEREQIHYTATLNNLINLASKNCLARKQGIHTAIATDRRPATPSHSRFSDLGVSDALDVSDAMIDTVIGESAAKTVASPHTTDAPPFTIVLTRSGQTAHVHLGWTPKDRE